MSSNCNSPRFKGLELCWDNEVLLWGGGGGEGLTSSEAEMGLRTAPPQGRDPVFLLFDILNRLILVQSPVWTFLTGIGPVKCHPWDRRLASR
jgi:hypothetical protein